MRWYRYPFILLAATLIAFTLSTFPSTPQTLTFEERAKAQEAIERVYYTHRIWPEENPQPTTPRTGLDSTFT